MVTHQRRHDEIGQPNGTGGREIIEAIVGDRRLDRRVFRAPVRQQTIEADRIDDSSGQNVGAHLGPLLHNHDRNVRIDLLEADGRRQP